MYEIRKGVTETPFQPIVEEAAISSTDLVITHTKGSDFQQNNQYHPCTICGNWTRCLGYTQWVECKSRILRKGVQDE